MDLGTFLMSLGINLSSSIIYDFIKLSISKGKTRKEIIHDLSNYLQIEGSDVDVKSEKIIDFLIDNGTLCIENSKIYSNEAINYHTSTGKSSIAIKNTTSKTDSTEISVNGNTATIKMSGNAEIIQDEKGIKFVVGK